MVKAIVLRLLYLLPDVIDKDMKVYIYIYIYIYIFFFFLAALGLCCCTQAFSSCGEQWLLFIAVHGLLIAEVSLVAEHGL